MDIRLKFVLLFIFPALTLFASEVSVIGNIGQSASDIELYIVDPNGQQPLPVAINPDEASYRVVIDIDKPVFIYLVGNIHGAAPKTIYTPIYLTPDNSKIRIDLAKIETSYEYVPTDNDNKALASYYQDFLIGHLSNVPANNDISVTSYLKRILESADSIAKTASTDIVKDYLALRGYIDYVSVTMQIQRAYRERGKIMPQAVVAGIKPISEIIKNRAAIYFPQEIASLVMADIAIGKTIHERLARLHKEVNDSAIVANTETLLLWQFVATYDFSQGVEAGFATLDSIAKGHSQYEEMVAQLKMRSYSLPGAEAPDVVLTDVKGGMHRLSDFKGKYIYVDFWASWCGPCNMEIPYMKELERTLGNEMVVFVGISIDEDIDAWKSALARHSLKGNQFIGNQELAQMLNVQSIPRYVIYGKDGKLLNADAPRPSSGDEIRSILMKLK